MKKRLIPVLLALWIMVALVLVPGVQAQTGPTISSSTVDVDFPLSVVFNVTAQSDADITDLRLNYLVERREHARIVSEVYIPVSPSTSVTETWTWDMRMTGGMPPGTGIEYWWIVTDASGQTETSLPQRFVMEDNRYDWRSLEEGMVSLFWYNGDDTFAQELMDATQDALTRLSDTAGASLDAPVTLYIYANANDLRGALIYAQEWTGGVAFTRFGSVAIGIGTSSSELAWGKRTIAHELTHLVVDQVIFHPLGSIPTWLSEGLAMFGEGELTESFVNVFNAARDNDSLISVRSLSSPFSAYSNQSYLAYAQSYYIVSYLIDTYGRDKMLELLDTFAGGAGYDEALEKVYGFDMDGLNSQWLASVTSLVKA